MPELPEVETIANQLRQSIIGKTISQFDVRLPKMVWLDNIRAVSNSDIAPILPLVEQHNIEEIDRRGKMMIIHLSGETTLLVHLKMTGQLIVENQNQRIAGGHPSKDMLGELPAKSTHVVIHFTDGSRLYFNDLRQFGYIKIIPKHSLATHQTYRRFGPEPLSEDFNTDYLILQINKHPKISIKQLLLDQTVIAGIGNIYADESLFSAKVNPSRKVSSLTNSEINALVIAIKATIEKAIAYGGTSQKDYIQPDGQKGSMQDHLDVYQHTGQSCPRCGTPIERSVIAGRGTHYCPKCQK